MRSLMMVAATVALLLGTTSTPAVPDKSPPTLADDTPKAKDLIVGKWEIASGDPKQKGTIEFQQGGNLIITATAPVELTIKGKYKFLDEDTMEVELTPPVEGADKVTQKVKVKVTKDELITIDEKKKEDKFKRVK